MEKLISFLKENRAFIVKYFALNYETKIFGKSKQTGKYLRAVLPILLSFYIAICSTLIIDNFNWWETINEMGLILKVLLGSLFVLFYFIFWTPFIVCVWIGFPWFGKGYFELFPLKYAELVSNSQKFQLLNKPEGTGLEDETFPEEEKLRSEYLRLKKWNYDKFVNRSNVNVLLGVAPFVLLVGGFYIAYLIMS